MRIVGNIPHEKFHMTLYEWNEKMIIKIEAGPMEQVYKFSKEVFTGIEGAQKLMTTSFLEKVYDRFTEMYLDMEKLSESKGE